MQSECKIQPTAGPSGIIAVLHHFKRSKCTARTTLLGQPWRYVMEGGKLVPFRCPNCQTVIRHLKDYNDDAITCSKCAWIPEKLTPDQKAALRTDPELKLAHGYLTMIEYKDNPKNIKGKTKRDKKFLSKACY